jgi:hypothetical protein
MGVFSENAIIGASAAGGYDIDQSLRFNDPDSAYLSRTPGSSGNRRTWTWSGWVKRANLGVGYQSIFSQATGTTPPSEGVWFSDDNFIWTRLGNNVVNISSAVFRDPSAWYHVVVALDTPDGTPADRLKVWVNNEQITSWGTSATITLNADGYINHTGESTVGKSTAGEYFDGYLAEVHFIDGTALTPASFGETDAATNQWKPIEYTGSYGTNGFYQKYSATELTASFTDSSSSAHTITANGDVTNTRAVTKVNSSSMYIPAGTSNNVTLPALDFGSDDFTIEMWARDLDTSAMGHVWNNYNGSSHGLYIANAAPNLAVHCKFGGTSHTFSGTWNGNDWSHIAVVRNGSTVTLYADGSSLGTATVSGTMSSSGAITMGGTAATANGEGYFDEIRVSDTARYTGTYTPPTTAFTADSNTLLLIQPDWDGGLGADSSGNKNDFAVTNLVATDQMIDTPTNNYCTLNPLDEGWSESSNAGVTSEGNLKITNTAGGWYVPRGSIGEDSGKWYFEVLALASNTYMQCGIEDPENNAESSGNSYRYRSNGNKYAGAGPAAYGATWSSSGDIIGVAMNLDDNEVTFYKNNSTQGAISITSGVTYQPVAAVSNNGIVCTNFGQDSSFAGNKTAQGNGGTGEDFYYTPPAGFKALNTDNLSDPAIADPTKHFNTKLYDDGAGAKTGVGFQPDLVWVKSRGSAYEHELTDSVRGVTKALSSDSTNAETTDSTGLTAFGADGFTVGSDTNYSDTTGSGMVAWNWKAGGAASTIAAGSIDGTNPTIASSVSANPTAGFSVVGYTSPNTTVDETIGHGLSAAPEMVIVKNLDSAWNWDVYTAALTSGYDLKLNAQDAQASGRWSTTAPTASVVTVKYNYEHGTTNQFIAYCFHSIEGYSKVGSYVGNANADGTFVYCGFKPAYLLIKRTDGVKNWFLHDDKRSTYNIIDGETLRPNTSEAEVSTTGAAMDFVSNGFKQRTADDGYNSGTYLYLAFAESPFKYSNAR